MGEVDMQTDNWIYKYILWWVLEGKNARVLVGRTTGLCVVDRLSWKGILWKGSVQSRKYLSKLCIRVLCKHAQICGVRPTSSHILRDLIPLSFFFCRCFCVFFSTDSCPLPLSSLSYFELETSHLSSSPQPYWFYYLTTGNLTLSLPVLILVSLRCI